VQLGKYATHMPWNSGNKLIIIQANSKSRYK